jgi:putative sigma-54 modulation protein
MEIIIESPHFKVNELLNEFVTAKVSRLAHINDRIMKSEIFLRLDKSSTDDNKICEIKIFAPGHNLFASRKCLTFEDAVTQTVHALEEQLKKQKTKWAGSSEKIIMEDPLDSEEIE